MTDKPNKPMGRKAYGSIPHLPGSRMGSGDHACHEGQRRIATQKKRDAKDIIYVQEKLDGSCTAVGKVNGQIIPLGRAGYPAITSPYVQHIMFHDWAMERWQQFDALLDEGERAAGEWLALAHGTRYDLKHRSPWVLFDIIGVQDEKVVPRVGLEEMTRRASQEGFVVPPLLWEGDAVSIKAIEGLNFGRYGNDEPYDPVEGAVWRVERDGKVDFLVKWVRPDKVDGIYLHDTDAGKANNVTVDIWNWRPKGEGKAWWQR